MHRLAPDVPRPPAPALGAAAAPAAAKPAVAAQLSFPSGTDPWRKERLGLTLELSVSTGGPFLIFCFGNLTGFCWKDTL